MVELDDVAGESFAQIDHDIVESSFFIFHDDLRLGQVYVKVIERRLQFFDLIEQLRFVVVELD